MRPSHYSYFPFSRAFGPFIPQFFQPTIQNFPQKLRKNGQKIMKKLKNSNSGMAS